MDLTLRKTYRTQLTKLINNANELLNCENPKEEEMPVLVARLKSINEKLSDINKKVLPTIDQDQMENECQRAIEYEDEAVATIARLERFHGTVSVRRDAEIDRRRRSVTVGQDEVRSKQNAAVRLPQLELRKFNGDLNAWPSFWEQYRTAIHENNNLDDCAKFNYLQSLLESKAAATISGLTPSQACYKDAIEMLKAEYGNNERIVDNYIKQLMSLSPIKNKNDIVSLRKLYNVTSTITRSLLALGISANQYGMMVKSIIFKTIPYSMRVEFNKQRKNAEVANVTENASLVKPEENDYESQISGLLKFVKLEVESMENAQSINEWNVVKEARTNELYSYISNERRDRFKRKTSTAASLLTNVNENCLFCESKIHNTMNCNSSLTILQKKEILKQHSRCYRCTKAKHTSRFCRFKDIKCSKCNGRHATSMCDPNFAKRSNTERPPEASASSEQSTNLLANGRLDDVYLQTACAYVETNDVSKGTFIRMVLDGGSQLTFVKECVSRQLELPIIGIHKISILPFGSKKRTPARLCNKVCLKLKGQYSNDIIPLIAIEVPEICFDTLSTPSINDASVCVLQLADAQPDHRKLISGISLLIGADNYWKVVTGEYKRLTNGLTAVNTKLGWTLHGPSESNSYSVNLNVATILHIQTIDEDNNIKQFWDLETIGIKEEENKLQNVTLDFIDNKVVLKDNRYEVSLPWENLSVKLDSNYDGALARVKSLTSRLIKDLKLVEYDNAVREYLKNDCAEVAPKIATKHKTYFMPHRPVYREDKSTTKLRVVFGASAHAPGFPSLNELLMPGENLVPQMLRILLNFRVGSVGLIADIEKAFLQINLKEDDRDAHRYLWYEQPITSMTELPKLREYRMKRVTFGVTSSPFLLAVTLKKHLADQANENAEICSLMRESFYVDDLVVAVDSLEMGQRVYNKSKQIMSSASMILRKWHSNDITLSKYFNDNENEVKVLGVQWYSCTDELSVDLKPLLKEQESGYITKRCVLQTVFRIFDPLGVLGPFIVRAKIFLQEIWRLKLEWDELLSETLCKEWISWCSEISMLTCFSISRPVVDIGQKEIQLHIFADASMQAYGTVAYVRYTLQNNKAKCNLLIAKNRVAPINEQARVQDYILKCVKLNIVGVYLWSDSKIALYWIRGKPTKWKPYVSNRIAEIQHPTKEKWRKHCLSRKSCANLFTSGIRAKCLLEFSNWRFGPGWLKNYSDDWPPPDERCEYKSPKINSISRSRPLEVKTKNDMQLWRSILFPLEVDSAAGENVEN